MSVKAKKRHRILKTWVRIAIVAILVFAMSFSAYLIYSGKNPSDKNVKKYKYDINENINYKVYLKENEFFEEEYLGEGKQYTTQVIDYIDVNFDYEYVGTNVTNNRYRYEIIATLKGEYENQENGDAELWKKNYTLLSEKSFKVNSNRYKINENVKIDYSKYSRMVDNFRTKFRIAIDAYLDVKLLVIYDNELEGTSIKVASSNAMNLKIPLSRTTIKIDKQYDEHLSNTVVENSVLNLDSNKVKIGMVIFAVSFIIFILLSPKVFASKKTLYTRSKEKILRNYSEIIVTTDNIPNMNDAEILEINSFDDMVDIEEETKSPILLFEVEEAKECWFIIIKDKYVYRYILDSKNL